MLLAERSGGRVDGELVGEREEGDAAGDLRRYGHLRRKPDRDVRLVRQVPADLAGTGDAGRLRVDRRHGAALEAVELLVRSRTADAEEEVDARAERGRVVRRALAPDHSREDRVAVDAERGRALDRGRSGRERARRGGLARRHPGWE